MARSAERQNSDSAAALGWTPADFAAAHHGPELVEAVRRWQAAHWLQPTGVVDATTWRALQDHREGLEDRALRQPREDTLAGLCSASRYDPDSGAIRLSNRFRGITFHADAPVHLAQAAELHRRGVSAMSLPKHAIPPGWPAALEDTGLRLISRVRLTDAHVAGQEQAVAAGYRAGYDLRTNVVVLEVGADAWPGLVQDSTRLVKYVQALRLVVAGQGGGELAVAVALALRPNGMSLRARQACAALAWCNAYTPPIPGAWPGGGVEAALGQTVSAWSIFAKLRPTFAFPVYHVHAATTAAHVHRFRQWLAQRGARGWGWAGGLEHLDALLGPLPEHIQRID